MRQIDKSLLQLHKKIQDTVLDKDSFDLISLLGANESELEQIRKEEKDTELVHVDAFWDVTEEVYKKLIVTTIESVLLDFFIKLQQNKFSKLLNISYQFHPWNQFSLVAKDLHNSAIISKTNIYTSPDYAENQLQNLIDLFHINDSSWKEELYNFDYYFNFQSVVEEIFRDIAFSCWQKAKKETGSKVIGFIFEAKGGSYIYDLDNRNNLNEMKLTIPQYIDSYK